MLSNALRYNLIGYEFIITKLVKLKEDLPSMFVSIGGTALTHKELVKLTVLFYEASDLSFRLNNIEILIYLKMTQLYSTHNLYSRSIS